MKTAVAKVMWVGRASVFLVGLAVILALTVGFASTVLAAVPGDPFKLGRINTIDKATHLVGSANNALLRIDNDSKGPSATALELEVDPKKPPIRTNSLTKVDNLHADLLDGRNAEQFANGVGGTAVDADHLDGKDSAGFFSGKTYFVRDNKISGPGGGLTWSITTFCDAGDTALSGGGEGVDFAEPSLVSRDVAIGNGSTGQQGWQVTIVDNGSKDIEIKGFVLCADFPPLRQ